MRYLLPSAAAIVVLAAAPRVSAAQQTDTTLHRDTSHKESTVKRKAKNTASNAGEGVKQADSTVDQGAYNAGTAVKNVFRGKKGDKPHIDSAKAKPRDSTKAKPED
jgi:hypothetical protein